MLTISSPDAHGPDMTPNSPTLGFLIHDVARLWRKRFEQLSRDSGLTRSQWQVLAYLERNENIHQGGLAELLEVEPITSAASSTAAGFGLSSATRIHPVASALRSRRAKPARRTAPARRRHARRNYSGIPDADGDDLMKTSRSQANLTAACTSPSQRAASVQARLTLCPVQRNRRTTRPGDNIALSRRLGEPTAAGDASAAERSAEAPKGRRRKLPAPKAPKSRGRTARAWRYPPADRLDGAQRVIAAHIPVRAAADRADHRLTST